MEKLIIPAEQKIVGYGVTFEHCNTSQPIPLVSSTKEGLNALIADRLTRHLIWHKNRHIPPCEPTFSDVIEVTNSLKV